MEEQEQEPMEGFEQDSSYEAYAAHERIKAEILNRQSVMDENLAQYRIHTTMRDAKYPDRLSKEGKKAFTYWRQFQVCCLSLYGYMKPHIDNSKKKKKYEGLKELDSARVDLLNSKIKAAKWIDFYDLLNAFVYDLGVSKIELDKSRIDDYI